MPSDPYKFRELAHWYREFVQSAGTSSIWDSHLRTIEKLDAKSRRD